MPWIVAVPGVALILVVARTIACVDSGGTAVAGRGGTGRKCGIEVWEVVGKLHWKKPPGGAMSVEPDAVNVEAVSTKSTGPFQLLAAIVLLALGPRSKT